MVFLFAFDEREARHGGIEIVSDIKDVDEGVVALKKRLLPGLLAAWHRQRTKTGSVNADSLQLGYAFFFPRLTLFVFPWGETEKNRPHFR